jgi:hypothetical protein
MKRFTCTLTSLVTFLVVFSESMITNSAFVAKSATPFLEIASVIHYSQQVAGTKSKPASLKSLFEDLSNEDLRNKCTARQINLDGDNQKEIFIRLTTSGSCGGSGRCPISIVKRKNDAYQTVLNGISTSGDFAIFNARTNGWKDIATRSSLGKEFWSVWKFNGKEYQVASQKNIESISSNKIIRSKPCFYVLSESK